MSKEDVLEEFGKQDSGICVPCVESDNISVMLATSARQVIESKRNTLYEIVLFVPSLFNTPLDQYSFVLFFLFQCFSHARDIQYGIYYKVIVP